MGVPTRTNILLDIKRTLEAVTAANGFKTDVTKVEPFLRSRDEVELGERPYLGFGPDQETFEHYAFNGMRVTLPWTVIGYIAQDDWTLASAAINDLRDDVIAAIMADPTLGGTATLTKILSDLTSEADPNRADLASDGGAVALKFETVYHRDNSLS